MNFSCTRVYQNCRKIKHVISPKFPVRFVQFTNHPIFILIHFQRFLWIFHGLMKNLDQFISENSDASVFTNFHYPGTWNFSKIRCFTFLEFSWPRVHEISQKSDALVFSNFHYPRYMKILKNWMLQFSQIFMTHGTWNFSKIRRFSFLEISQKLDASIFSDFHYPRYMKFLKNQTLQFSPISITPVHEISQKSDASLFLNFHDPGYMKFHKNQTLQFSQFPLPPVHENSQKLDASIFSEEV